MVPKITSRYALKSLFYTAIFDTIIALFLTIVKFGNGLFWTNFTFSQCIGLSICSCMLVSHHLVKSENLPLQFILHLGVMLLGSIIGILLGSTLSGIETSIFFEKYPLLIQMVFFGLLFGSIISYFFMSRERLARSEARVREEKIRRLTSEKQAAETNLRLLQAQIEPHFLFNTLSNILSLLESDPEKGKSMLVDLNRYLRLSLTKSKERTTTLGQEIDLVRVYLNLFKVRMGERLHFHIDAPDEALHLPFPPMLIQPLVENAILHGLEPKIRGGKVTIKVALTDHHIRVEVMDNGRGFCGKGKSGFGLSNIQERLRVLYNQRAQFILQEIEPSGLRAIIEVPYDAG